MATDNKETPNSASELVIVDLAEDKDLRLPIRDYVHKTGKLGLPHELYRSPNANEVNMLSLAMKSAMFDIGKNKAWPKGEKDKSPFELINLNITVGGVGQEAYVLWSDGNMDTYDMEDCSDFLKKITAVNLESISKPNLVPSNWKDK